MAITRTQSNHAEGAGNGSSIAATLNGIASPSHVVVWVTVVDIATITNVQDDLLVTAALAKAGDDSTGAQRKEIHYFQGYTGGNRTFTANFGSSQPFRGIVVAEYGGVATTSSIDGTAGVNQTTNAASPASTGNLSPTPSVDGELIVGGISAQAQPSFAAPFSDVFQDTTSFGDSSDYIQPTAAAIAATFTYTGSVTWTAIAASFKPAAAASGGGWVGRGSRQAPGQKGPFDRRGFLMQRRFDYTPSAAVVVTVKQRKTLGTTGNHVGGRQRRGQ